MFLQIIFQKKLSQLFLEVLTEKKMEHGSSYPAIDFEKPKQFYQEIVDGQESYGFMAGVATITDWATNPKP